MRLPNNTSRYTCCEWLLSNESLNKDNSLVQCPNGMQWWVTCPFVSLRDVFMLRSVIECVLGRTSNWLPHPIRTLYYLGPSCLWSHCSWIYNYTCNQCLSPLTLWVRIGGIYSIQHYVIIFVSDLREGGSFLPGTPVSSTNKANLHDITEILLKMALNNITLTLKFTILYEWLTHLYLTLRYDILKFRLTNRKVSAKLLVLTGRKETIG